MEGMNSLIVSRRSYMAFLPDPIEEDKIALLLEAARWAPSTFNAQPWRFLVARNTGSPEWHLLFDALSEKNQVWAKHAYLLILMFASEKHPSNGTLNPYAKHDCGLALQNILLQAGHMGLASHPMAGFDAQKIISGLNVAEKMTPLTITAIGSHGRPEALSPEHLQREKGERDRLPLKELVLSL